MNKLLLACALTISLLLWTLAPQPEAYSGSDREIQFDRLVKLYRLK